MENISPFAPRAVRRPVMLQCWRSLTFLHWKYEPDRIRALLPAQVTLDTFDGAAWIGLTPFLLTGLRAPLLPGLPWVSRFAETNVRTYVRGPDGERGVWFFTLDAARLMAVLGARALYHLPYRWARMRVKRTATQVKYSSRRRAPFGRGTTDVVIEPGPLIATDVIAASPFDNYLTARYRLYTVHRERLLFAQIDHEPWPLQSARVVRLEQNLIENSGVPKPTGDPVVHFSSELTVRIGPLQRFRRESRN